MFLFNAILIVIVLLLILVLFNILIYKKTWIDREKITSFECGFDPLSDARLPFSIQFFLIALVFLVFDVEIVLLLPLAIRIKMLLWEIIMRIVIVFIILLLGIYLEWIEGTIQWFD